jgi:hypothetical protein
MDLGMVVLMKRTPKDKEKNLKDDLKEICETLFSGAIMQLAEKRMFQSLFFALNFATDASGKDEIMPIFFGNDINTDLIDLPTVMHQLLSQQNPDAFLTLFVAKAVKVEKEREEELLKWAESGQPMENHPEAQDFLCLYYMNAEGDDVHSIMSEIKRDPIGTPYVEDSDWSTEPREGTFLVLPWR